MADEDLVGILAPTDGAPTVLLLSFCDSHEVAALLHDRDIAVVSFEGQVLDDAAATFYEVFYEALLLGRSIELAFEVAHTATRGTHGLTARINGYTSGHARTLPPQR